MHDVDRKDSLQHLIKDLEAALYIAKNALAVKSKEDEEYMENLRRHGREALLRSPSLALIQDSMNDSNTEPKRRSSSLPRESSVQAAPYCRPETRQQQKGLSYYTWSHAPRSTDEM
jgi:hypothetical protein